MLRDANANLDNINQGRISPLKLDCYYEHIDVIRLLLERYANDSVINMDLFDILKVFFQNNANINGLDRAGNCLLYKACQTSNLDLLKFIFSLEANPNILNNKKLILL